MHALHVHHLIEYQMIEFDEGSRILVAPPPEPATTGFMKRTEDTGGTNLL